MPNIPGGDARQSRNNVNPIMSRDDLSFTKRDAAGRLINWCVSPDPMEDWHEKFALGQESFSPDREPRPMHAEEAIGYFLACSKAVASLEVILGEIDGNDNLLAQGRLISTGLGIAEWYADLAERWRDDLKAGGFHQD